MKSTHYGTIGADCCVHGTMLLHCLPVLTCKTHKVQQAALQNDLRMRKSFERTFDHHKRRSLHAIGTAPSRKQLYTRCNGNSVIVLIHPKPLSYLPAF